MRRRERLLSILGALIRVAEELIETLSFLLFAMVFYSLWAHNFVFFLWLAGGYEFYLALAVYCVVCSFCHLARNIAILYRRLRKKRYVACW